MKLSVFYGKVHCAEDNPMVSLREIVKLIQAEQDTWAKQSIGWKAVESVKNALQESLPLKK